MTPVLGSAYQATCRLTVDSEINLDEMIGPQTMQWLGPDGEHLHTWWSSPTFLEIVCSCIIHCHIHF